jgi:adenosylcobyric acid synthase
MLQEMTGIPTVATLPMWWHHGLPEEDGLPLPLPLGEGRGGGTARQKIIAVIAYPRISNHDEFQPLANIPGVQLRWARTPSDLNNADWIILPGSKHTSGDLAWLRSQKLDRAIAEHAARGGAVLGICGGLQMLGEALVDPHGIDGNAPGLGLLPLVTVFERDKTVKRTQARFGQLTGPWEVLSGMAAQGYEIHHGQTSQHAGMQAGQAVLPDNLGWQSGNVLGVYLHGLLEDAAVLRALFGDRAQTLDSVFDGLADFINKHFARGVIANLIR